MSVVPQRPLVQLVFHRITSSVLFICNACRFSAEMELFKVHKNATMEMPPVKMGALTVMWRLIGCAIILLFLSLRSVLILVN